MRRSLEGGYEIDDDRDRVDVEAVHRFLSTEAYWVPGRSRETIGPLVRSSSAVWAGYAADGSLVGFARVMSDGANMAWLGDVFVLGPHRGRGIGTALVEAAVNDPPYASCLWYLNTRDAQALYERFGFEPADPGRTMTRRRRS